MAQILNDAPGIGALLGTGLGQGISSGLQQLAQLKTSQLLTRNQQRQTAQGLHSLGFSPQEALQVSLLPQELQSLVIKNYLQSAENAGLEQALQGTRIGSEPATEAIGLEQIAERAESPMQKKPGLSALLGIKEPSILNKELPTEKALTNALEPSTGATQERESLSNILRRPRLSPEHRLKVEALKQQRDIAQQKLSAKEQEEVNKETKTFYDDIQRAGKAAKEGNIRLDKMEDLIKKGNLTSPLWASLLKTASDGIFGFGLDLPALKNADSQEFEKLSNDFIKNAKDYFPGRILDSELRSFIKTIPTLSQTRAGKLRVIKNLREFNAIALANKEASDRILKQAGGKRPRGFEQMVEESVAPQIERIKKEFANMAVPVDERYFREFFNG